MIQLAEGYDGNARWSIEGNNPARVERGAARRFAVLAITPEAGRPFELWLDSESWLADRVIEQGASDTITTTFSDYRRIHGALVPFALRESNGDAKYDSLITVESLAFGGAVADAAFAPPASPARDFGIAGGGASNNIPFELANDHIFVEMRLAGSAVTLLCDGSTAPR